MRSHLAIQDVMRADGRNIAAQCCGRVDAEVAVLQRLLGRQLTASVGKQVEGALVYGVWHAGVQQLAAKQTLPSALPVETSALHNESAAVRIVAQKASPQRHLGKLYGM
jgi:hypothetical protein